MIDTATIVTCVLAYVMAVGEGSGIIDRDDGDSDVRARRWQRRHARTRSCRLKRDRRGRQ